MASLEAARKRVWAAEHMSPDYHFQAMALTYRRPASAMMQRTTRVSQPSRKAVEATAQTPTKKVHFAPLVGDVADVTISEPIQNDPRQGRGHDTARERVGHVQLEQADMEHRMDLHGSWQQEPVGTSPDRLDDWVGPKTTNIQFGRRAPGGDMAAKQPHFLSWSKIWCRSATPIRGELHRFPSF